MMKKNLDSHGQKNGFPRLKHPYARFFRHKVTGLLMTGLIAGGLLGGCGIKSAGETIPTSGRAAPAASMIFRAIS